MTQPTMKDLFNKIEVLEEYFKEYPNPLKENALQGIKEKFKDKQTYKIAIVANMSAGKSTLINALFGEEILPSFNEATSDCIVEITSMPKIPKKAAVFFEDKSPITLEEKDFKELKQYAQKDSKCEEKYQKVEKIKLFYPFLHIQNKQESKQKNIEILFIDTPGPNNTGEFRDKHKNQTKTVLNNVDMALFAFDYGQLDANLTSDEQGLWHTIKERKEKDKDFEVFFLLNKIDMALKDNDEEMKQNHSNLSREEEQELKKKYWGRHEEKAIAKLEKAANNHGIQNPQILALSSYYELLRRNDNRLLESEEEELDKFEKRFRRIFGEKWEQELINYTGFEKLEEAMNQYIDKQVSNKILKKYSNEIRNILEEEKQAILRSIESLKKPKEESEQNIKNAKEFLQKELPQIQEATKANIAKSKERTKKEVESTIEKWIQQKFIDKVEELVLKTVIFMHEFVEGAKNPAQQVEKTLKIKHFDGQNYLRERTFHIDGEEEEYSLHSETSQYLNSLIENCKNSFLDIQSEIKRHYASLNVQCNQNLQDFKGKIEEKLNQELQIEIKEQMQPIAIDYSETLNLSTSIPESVLSYTYQEEQYIEVDDSTWYIPWTWGDTRRVKTQDEEHTLTIDPEELQEAIENTLEEQTEHFKREEIKRHQEAIASFGDKTLQKSIEDIAESKKQEIDKLEKVIQDAQNNLEKSQKQQEALKNIQEKMGESFK